MQSAYEGNEANSRLRNAFCLYWTHRAGMQCLQRSVMRFVLVLTWFLAALSVRGVTPEMGKEKLRKLVRLPAIVFQAEWKFDPERGFIMGSGNREALARISEIRRQLTVDAGDAERYENLGELFSSVGDLRNAENAWRVAAGLYRRRV